MTKQALYNYEDTVLIAFNEVEDALSPTIMETITDTVTIRSFFRVIGGYQKKRGASAIPGLRPFLENLNLLLIRPYFFY